MGGVDRPSEKKAGSRRIFGTGSGVFCRKAESPGQFTQEHVKKITKLFETEHNCGERYGPPGGGLFKP
ncbi:hypothetical protein CLOSTASPAR_03230 [[Clostridium] asparagiforme DSM 15981]|uniref:Uncharacterized protein n=1 Tax=[Clostridium] asparagiforme DSM 15981 TaxID=518636 RepID=C0D1U1_9FIRM|nr:hypothetical protein CLOSTASPAR_03230 [[Clostridium] asparagiforme DSM 15981]